MSRFAISWRRLVGGFTILLGLFCAATCLADDPWPANEGPHTDKKGPCNILSAYCFGGSCMNKQPGDDPTDWTCDSVAYLSLLRLQARQWGDCSNSSGDCTYYDKFYCAEYAVYQYANCQYIDPNNPEKCRRWVFGQGCGAS
jgi:hypothetical protein